MTSETSRRSRSFCLQNKTSLASLETTGLVCPTTVSHWSSRELTHLRYSSYRAGCGRYYRTWIWPPCCVPGCGRPRDRRYARYALGHDACSFAGGEEARQKSQGRWLAQVTIGVQLLYQHRSISGILGFGLVFPLTFGLRSLLNSNGTEQNSSSYLTFPFVLLLDSITCLLHWTLYRDSPLC